MAQTALPTSRDLRRARELYRELLDRPTVEKDWQAFFSQHPYIFSLTLGVKLQPSDIVPLGRPGKSEPDFAFYPNEQGVIPFCGLIELKRPDSAIVRVPRSNVAILSQDAQTAVAQLRQYSNPTRLQNLIPLVRHQALFLGNNMHLFAIIGRSAELQQLGVDLYNQIVQNLLPPNVRLIPFDILLRQFEEGFLPTMHVLSPWNRLSESQLEGLASSDPFAAIDAIIAGTPVSTRLGVKLTEFVFSVFEGGGLTPTDALKFASYISCFSESFNAAAYALYYVGKFHWNQDWTGMAAVFGLGISRNRFAQELFESMLKDPSGDFFDKCRGFSAIIEHSNAFPNIPENLITHLSQSTKEPDKAAKIIRESIAKSEFDKLIYEERSLDEWRQWVGQRALYKSGIRSEGFQHDELKARRIEEFKRFLRESIKDKL